MILDSAVTCVELPGIHTAVYGFSYHTREIREKVYEGVKPQGRQPYEILMLHGGDEKHMPLGKEEVRALGYAYTALGHIHKPCEIYPDRMAYAGALEPIDKNDTGAHGFIKGELTSAGCRTEFVPAAVREYRHETVEVSEDMTGYAVREQIKARMDRQGTQHMYKITLTGFRDPDILFDVGQMDPYGNVVEITDETKPAYDLDRLKEQNRDNILGMLIDELGGADRDSIEYQALCEGVQALMETRRG